MVDRLTNAELGIVPDDVPTDPYLARHPGYWSGSAGGEVQRLRAENARLRAECAQWRRAYELAVNNAERP